MRSPLTSAHRAPGCRFASFWKKWHGDDAPRENPPSSKTCAKCSLHRWPASKDPYMVFRSFPHTPTPGSFAFGSSPGNRTHTHRELRPRRSGLGSHLQLRSKGDLPRRCRWEDWLDTLVAHLRTHQTRAVTWDFSATFVGINPFVPVPLFRWHTRTTPCPTNTVFLFDGQFWPREDSQVLSLTSSSASQSLWVSSSASTAKHIQFRQRWTI